MGYRQEEQLRKGPWLEEEDERLAAIVAHLGDRRWDSLAKASGLRRTGKSCRLRWLNYLRPNLRCGRFTAEEEHIILQLHELWGNKWSKIARRLPGRTDNDIKNYWRTHLSKKAQVQVQGDLVSVTNDVQRAILVPKCDLVTQRTGNGDCMADKNDMLGTSIDSSKPLELSNFLLFNSPCETQLSDWMSCWLYEQSDQYKHQGDHCNLDSCNSLPQWIFEDSDSGEWDSSSFLWGMD